MRGFHWLLGLLASLLVGCGMVTVAEPTNVPPTPIPSPTVPPTAAPTPSPALPTPDSSIVVGPRLLNAETRWFVDPYSHAQRQIDAWRSTRPDDAAMLEKIARHSKADWFGDWNKDIRSEVAARIRQIREAGALPVMVAYNIPARDCGLYSSGGVNSPDGYRAWIDDFAAGIGDQPAVVVLEPDALAGITCLTPENQRIRYELLSYAVEQLTTLPHTAVYIDAGNAQWVSVAEMADRLKRVKVELAAGFALNVSNFIKTSDTINYGTMIAKTINAEKPIHFVIDTSRNGLGPLPVSEDPTGENWCNPPGRALGTPPTTETDSPLVDAYLWVKGPGESDGTCKGGPRAGEWWPEYALGLAQRAEWE